MRFEEKTFRYLFGCGYDGISPSAVINPFWPLRMFKSCCRIRSTWKGSLFSVAEAESDGKSFTIVNCGIGVCLAGDSILFLEKGGLQELVFTGTCGGLAPCRIGDMISVTGAYNGEGFTRYHAEGATVSGILESATLLSCDRDLAGRLFSHLCSAADPAVETHSGPLFTAGSLLAETEQAFDALGAKGILGVEMEMSAVCAAAAARGIKASGVVVVSDLPATRPLGTGLSEEERELYNLSVRRMIRSAVELLVS